MKIFRLFTHNKANQTSLYDDVDIATIPDTALLIQKRPFFVPDFTNQCMAQLCACIRINRLGRSINERFAHRYYDANQLTLGVHFVARDLFKKLQNESRPCDLAIGFDNSVVVAEKSCVEQADTMSAVLCQNEIEHVVNFSKQVLLRSVDKYLAYVSEFYTMRQGDILLLPLTKNEVQVGIDDQLKLLLNKQPLITFNVK